MNCLLSSYPQSLREFSLLSGPHRILSSKVFMPLISWPAPVCAPPTLRTAGGSSSYNLHWTLVKASSLGTAFSPSLFPAAFAEGCSASPTDTCGLVRLYL